MRQSTGQGPDRTRRSAMGARVVGLLGRLQAALGARSAVFAIALVSSVACSDVTAPIQTDPNIDQKVLPSVIDAQLRLAKAIENQGVRDRIGYDLKQLEDAINKRDAQRARYHVRIAGGILADYRRGLGGIVTDGPDVGAIALALHAASVAVGGTFDVTTVR